MKLKIGVIIGLISVLFLLGCSSSDAGGDFSGEVYEIPLNQVTTKVQKFEHDANGVKVKFFVVKGSDGEVRTAFDACDVCGGSKGYRQEGGDIACNNCGRVFDIDGLGTKNKGYGCWPSYLSHKIEKGNVVISQKEIEEGAHRFA